jgi:transposase
MLLDHPSDGPATIRTHIGAIFVSLELSGSNWLVTSLSPGKGEKISKHSITAGDVAGLMRLFAELRRKAEVRTGQSYPIVTIQEAGLDGFWLHRVLQQNGICGPKTRAALECVLLAAWCGVLTASSAPAPVNRPQFPVPFI